MPTFTIKVKGKAAVEALWRSIPMEPPKGFIEVKISYEENEDDDGAEKKTRHIPQRDHPDKLTYYDAMRTHFSGREVIIDEVKDFARSRGYAPGGVTQMLMRLKADEMVSNPKRSWWSFKKVISK